MWGMDPSIWNSTAPILFPIVGCLKDNNYLWKGEKYSLTRHGFIRENPQLLLTGITAGSLTFGMNSNKETHKIYPFDFDFSIQFLLEGAKIKVNHKVVNTGNSELYFSLGGHPAFRCPVHADEKYEDYYLEFDQPEQVSTWLLTGDGLLSGQTEPVLKGSNILPLSHELFSKDALIFKDLKSKKVTLRNKKSTQALSFSFEDFPYLGVWAKTNGNFVCIEPWLGVADSWNTDQLLEHKEGILQLAAGEVFEASYFIEIQE